MQNLPELPPTWEKLAAAYRRSRAALPARDEAAPFGFAQRLAAQTMALRQNERLAWWTRWSMRATLATGIAAAVVVMRAPATDREPVLLSPPVLEIPGFSTP
jgi:hypothetical protein